MIMALLYFVQQISKLKKDKLYAGKIKLQLRSLLWPFLFFMAVILIIFNHENTNDSTKKEDHDYGSSLLCATDQQTKQGQALRL